MNKKFEIEIEEILQKVVKIEANSLKDAINIAKEKYYNEEYVLDSNNFKETNFKEYKNNFLKEKKQTSRESR
jgi:hypothetical protein